MVGSQCNPLVICKLHTQVVCIRVGIYKLTSHPYVTVSRNVRLI